MKTVYPPQTKFAGGIIIHGNHRVARHIGLVSLNLHKVLGPSANMEIPSQYAWQRNHGHVLNFLSHVMNARMGPCFNFFIICYGCMDVHYFTMTSMKVFMDAVLAVMDSSERAVMGLE